MGAAYASVGAPNIDAEDLTEEEDKLLSAVADKYTTWVDRAMSRLREDKRMKAQASSKSKSYLALQH